VDMSRIDPGRALGYANRLIAAIKAKSKPEGCAEAIGRDAEEEELGNWRRAMSQAG